MALHYARDGSITMTCEADPSRTMTLAPDFKGDAAAEIDAFFAASPKAPEQDAAGLLAEKLGVERSELVAAVDAIG